MRKGHWLVGPGVILLLAAVAPCLADAREETRPRIGLVLSGGGARGGAQVGVIKVLEELRIPVDYISGTSVGSIVGGLYASGMSPDEIEAAVIHLDWDAAFDDAPDRRRISFRRKQDDDESLFPFEIGVGRRGVSFRSGLVAGQNVNFVLRGLTLHAAGVDRFDDLPIPYRAVAADLDTGDMVVIDRGDLAEAMRASMAVPGVFTPVERDGKFLVDGGIARNLPVDVARDMGADRIIAVDVGTYSEGAHSRMSAFGVLSRTFLVLSNQNVLEQLATLGESDLLIQPELDKVNSADFKRITDAVASGEAAARRLESELRRFSVSEEEFAAHLARRRSTTVGRADEIVIDEVEVRVTDRIAPAIVERRMGTAPGEVLDLDTLEADLERIFRMGEFEQVDFRLEDNDGRRRLVIDARDKSWGPGYVRFGVGIESSLDGDSNFRGILNYRRTHVNRLGAELRAVASLGDPTAISGELFQPLERSGLWFAAPVFSYSLEDDNRFLADGRREVVQVESFVAGLDVGARLGNLGEVRIGARRGRLDSTPDFSGSPLPAVDVNVGGWRARATVDLLDNAFFPSRGVFGDLQLVVSRDTLGADDEYEKLSARWIQAGSFGENTLVGALRLGTDLGSEIPDYDEFELGGFLNLSGLRRGQVRGDVQALATLGYYRRVMGLGALGRGLYVGGSIQAGNAWQDLGAAGVGDLRPSATLFVGADTRLSPVYVGYGIAEGGEDDIYLFVGRLF